MNKFKFYDTSSLLLLSDEELHEYFTISSITLSELENIKTSRNKDSEIKAQARHVTKILLESNNYEVQIFQEQMMDPILSKGLESNNDTEILACAIYWETKYAPDDMTFITNDLCLYNIANLFFGTDSIDYITPKVDNYKGYKDITLTNSKMEYFYSNYNENMFNLLPNEYLIIRDEDNKIVERLCWTGTEYRHLDFNSFHSRHFGDIKPIKGDVY